jgi:phosphoglucomutase
VSNQATQTAFASPNSHREDSGSVVRLSSLSRTEPKSSDLAGEPIQNIQTHAAGTGAPIGGFKIVTENGWFAARPSETENINEIYAESFSGQDHLRRILEEAQNIANDALRDAFPHPIGTIK